MHSEFLFSIFSLCEIAPLSQNTIECLKNSLTVESFHKGCVITENDRDLKRIGFIRKGMVQGFVRFKKKEITNWISIEREIFASSSFFEQQTFTEEIRFLEDSTIEFLSLKHFKELLHQGDFKELTSIVYREYYNFANKRAFIARIPKAKDRLEYLLNNYNSGIVERCPNKYLASFLNMRPETLSRLILIGNKKPFSI